MGNLNINFQSILNPEKVSQEEWNSSKCDKWDYVIATFCGVLAGFIDEIFVKAPKESFLGEKTDKLTENLIQAAGKHIYLKDHKDKKTGKMPTDIKGWIRYLEKRYPVPYDATSASVLDVEGDELSDMNSINHHLLSLAHSPDPIGLICSIIDQFNDYGTYIDKGKIIHARYSKANSFELQGEDLRAKLFAGFVN